MYFKKKYYNLQKNSTGSEISNFKSKKKIWFVVRYRTSSLIKLEKHIVKHDIEYT